MGGVRRALNRLSAMPVWLVILILFFATVGLGLWGLRSGVAAPAPGLWGIIEDGYRVLQLFVFDSDWLLRDPATTAIPWQLKIVMFAGPLITVLAFLQVVSRDVRAWSGRVRNRHLRRDHVIVCGLGNKGRTLAEHCRKAGMGVVAIECDGAGANLSACRDHGIGLVLGDARDPAVLTNAGLRRAQALVAVAGEDGLNADIAILARAQAPKPRRGRSPRIVAHVSDGRLIGTLERYMHQLDPTSPAGFRFLNTYAMAARALFHDHPPDLYADLMAREGPHLALFGMGQMGEHVLLQAARICHFRNGARLRVSVFDRAAERVAKRIRSSYPQLGEVCELAFLAFEFDGSELKPDTLAAIPADVTQHLVLFDSDRLSLALAVALREGLLRQANRNAPIIARMSERRGLSKVLLSEAAGARPRDNIFTFGTMDAVLHPEAVIDERLDEMARAVHEDAYRPTLEADSTRSTWARPAAVGWDRLGESYRASNRQFADHIPVKLRAINCRRGGRAAEPTLGADEIALLARLEHARWCAERFVSGWQHGPRRSEQARIHDKLVPWENLDEATKAYDRELVESLPRLLSKAGRPLRREFVIGVTGHRPDKIDTSSAELRSALTEALAQIRKAHPDRAFVVLSALAEGADRLVAELAMRHLGAALRVVLPLPYLLYQTDFWHTGEDDAQAKADRSMRAFHALLRRAERCLELPLRFGALDALGHGDDGRPLPARNRQYALAGAYIAERSHALLALWDGKPEAGVGGTGQVVRWREAGAVEPAFSTRTGLFAYPAMTPAVVIAPPG